MLVDVSYKVGGSGLCSTAAVGQAMEAGKVVKPETRDLMWTAQKTRDGIAPWSHCRAAPQYGAGRSSVRSWAVWGNEETDVVLESLRRRLRSAHRSAAYW